MFKNITIVNAHWNNRGDEAAHLAFIEKLQTMLPKSKITILIKDGKSIEQFPNIKNVKCLTAKFKVKIWEIWLSVLTKGFLVKNKELKKTIIALKKSDLIIYPPGGSVINDRFFWWKQMEYLTPFLCAKLYRIPMFIASPSIGPFQKQNIIRKWLLKTPKTMCVREDISRKYLEEIGIKKNVHVTMDLAFMNGIDKDENEKKLEKDKNLTKFLSQNKKIIGITISNFKWHVKYGKDQSLMKRIDDSFHQVISELEAKDYAILFIPQLFGNQNDTDYLTQFKTQNSFMLDENYNTYFQQYIISKLYAVIGLRYHSNIFAAKMKTPFISVVYEEKMEGFLKLAELTDYSIPLQDISSDKILEKLFLLKDNYQNIKDQLESKNEIWKKNAEKTMNLFEKHYITKGIVK